MLNVNLQHEARGRVVKQVIRRGTRFYAMDCMTRIASDLQRALVVFQHDIN